MTGTVVMYSLPVCMLVISVLSALLVYYVRQKKDENKILRARQELLDDYMEKHTFNNTQWYNKTQLYLSRVGANYIFRRVINPEEYIIMRAVLAVIFGTLGYMLTGVAGFIVGAAAGYMLLKLFFEIVNRRDNEKMLVDIMSIYETIKIKTESGMFLTDALNSCYRVAENERLKSELLIMVSEISAKHNIMEAVTKFNLKFSNIHITTLCSIIRQGYETGDTLTAINNISSQLHDVQRAMELKSKQKLEREITKIMLVILLSIMTAVYFVLIKSMSNLTIM